MMEFEECLKIMSLGVFSGGLFTIAPVMLGYAIEKAFNLLVQSSN